MAAGHSHRSVICKGIYVLPERKPLTAVSFRPILISMSPCSRAGYSSSYRESYSRFPPQLQSWRIRKSALWNFHCIYVLPGRRLFIAFSFWHNSNDSPRISPASIFGLKGSFLQLYFILAYFWSCYWDSGLKGSFLQLYFILAYFWWHIWILLGGGQRDPSRRGGGSFLV